MAKTNIVFNNTTYQVEESSLAPAAAELRTHLSTTMSGSGASINFGGTSYNIDSAKLSTARNEFTSHLRAISGNGHKVSVGGVEYGVDSSKVQTAVSELEIVLGNLNNPVPEVQPEVITYYTQEDIDNSGGMMMALGATNPLYVVAALSSDFSTITITKNGADSDGLMMDLYYDAIGSMGIPVTTIIIENGVVNIGAFVASNCKTITSVSIPNSVATIGSCAFYGCDALTSVDIPNGVTSIEGEAFYHCDALTSVTLGSSVITIGYWAFNGCYDLTSVDIPDSVTSIGEQAFWNCNLTSITFNGTMAQWNAITKGSYWNNSDQVDYVQCSDGRVYLNSSAPEEERLGGDGSEFYTLAPTALSFRSSAPLNELQEIQINGVTVDPSNYTLEEGSTIVTFNIDYLNTLNVGSYEVAVASDSKTVKGDFSVVAPELNEYGFYYNQPYTAYVNAMGLGRTIVIIRENGTIDLMIQTYDDYVTTICTYIIDGDSMTVTTDMGIFTFVICPDGIYSNEFSVMFVLNDELYAADNDFMYIYDHDLSGYDVKVIDTTKSSYGLIKPNINGIDIVSLSKWMFYDTVRELSSPITNIVVPDSIMIIKKSAFFNCDSLESVTFGKNSKLNRIEDSAFEGCTSLASITIPDSVYMINNHAFSDCVNLNEFVCPNELITIGFGTFLNCRNLNSIVIPVDTKYIKELAFGHCTSLTNITYKGTMAEWNTISFDTNWNYNVPATHVQCSDGQVAL